MADKAPIAAWRKTAAARDNRISPSFGPCAIRRSVTMETRPAVTVEAISIAAVATCAVRAQSTPDNIAPAKTASMKVAATSKVVMMLHHCRRLAFGSIEAVDWYRAIFLSLIVPG